VPRLGNLGGVVVLFGLLQVDPLLLVQLEDPDPMDLRIAGLVVLPDAAVDAAAASDAAREIERVSVQDPFDGRGRLHLDRLAEPGAVFLLQAGEDLLQPGFIELPEVFLEKRLPDGGGGLLPGKGERAQARGQPLQSLSAREPEGMPVARLLVRHVVVS
jgi:hypothetical protein